MDIGPEIEAKSRELEKSMTMTKTKFIIGRPLLWFLFQWRLNWHLRHGWRISTVRYQYSDGVEVVNIGGLFGQALLIVKLEKPSEIVENILP